MEEADKGGGGRRAVSVHKSESEQAEEAEEEEVEEEEAGE